MYLVGNIIKYCFNLLFELLTQCVRNAMEKLCGFHPWFVGVLVRSQYAEFPVTGRLNTVFCFCFRLFRSGN